MKICANSGEQFYFPLFHVLEMNSGFRMCSLVLLIHVFPGKKSFSLEKIQKSFLTFATLSQTAGMVPG